MLYIDEDLPTWPVAVIHISIMQEKKIYKSVSFQQCLRARILRAFDGAEFVLFFLRMMYTVSMKRLVYTPSRL